MNTASSPSTHSPTNEYMLFFRGRDWDEGLSQEEIKSALERYQAWNEELTKSGKVKGGQVLGRAGATVSGKAVGLVSDGPFAESKEAVGGYMSLVNVTFEEAVAVARSCPGMDYGGSVEVRPVNDHCPAMKRAMERVGWTGSPMKKYEGNE